MSQIACVVPFNWSNTYISIQERFSLPQMNNRITVFLVLNKYVWNMYSDNPGQKCLEYVVRIATIFATSLIN